MQEWLRRSSHNCPIYTASRSERDRQRGGVCVSGYLTTMTEYGKASWEWFIVAHSLRWSPSWLEDTAAQVSGCASHCVCSQGARMNALATQLAVPFS